MQHHLSKAILLVVIFIFSFFPLISLAQQGKSVTAQPKQSSGPTSEEYKPITPGYSQIFDGSSGGGFEGMLSSIFKRAVYITVILSVIMIIIGGVQYMGSESIFAKDAGKDKIYAAISGLLLALVSILLISTILPGGDGSVFEIDIFG